MSSVESFGQRVKSRRRELGLTQEELAHRVGCAPITIRKTEHDDLRPSVQIAERLAMALNILFEERAAFVRLARTEHIPEPVTLTPMPRPDEIGLEDLSGRGIRGYALGERLGSGGMGAVYRAIQPLVEREVAFKIILPRYANQPDFIRRFETEAQLIARLEHPHIVPLYDYWREPGVAYIVMRLLRGGSVRNLLENGLLPLPTVERLIDQIGQALAAAHRVGVVHRDLKPANVLLDEEGNAYLADFGIARHLGNPNLENLTPANAIVGSPDYISPEQIRAEFVRPQTDIYCLGVMLYELLTGALPFRGPTPIEVMHEHLTAPLPPLAAHRAGMPAALDRVIQQATAKDPLQRYPDVEALLADWRQAFGKQGAVPNLAATHPLPALADTDNPYKGLRAFAEGDAADFFGREALTQQLLARLGEGGDLARFLAVVGPSGCGKSSVVRAGLIPALRRGGLPGSDKWFIVELMPGAHPFEELEAALLRIAVNPPESLLGQLREDARGLLRAVRRCLPDDPEVELVLVIDQFEEVFTLVQDEAVRALLLDSLVAAALDERSRVRLVLTLRADFIDRPLNYVDFGELLRQRMELVLPLTPDELERAITGPAERIGLQWDPGLVASIVRNVGDQPGALPLLQYALTGLYDRRDGRQLTQAAYQAIGGVLGALGRRAEEVYTSLDRAAQPLARQLTLRLVTLGEGTEDTRRRVLRAELLSIGQGEGQMATVIDTFGRHRLLAFDRDPVTRGATVEVAHEALLREWPRLRDWLSESRADVRLQRQLASAAADWQTANRDASFLLTGARLAQFEGWTAGTDLALTVEERAYLDASLAERQTHQAAEEARRRHELETAQKLAETEKRRAEEQTQNAGRLRQRGVYLVVALGAALVLLVATLGLAQLANQNLVVARAANTQAVAEVQNRSTAEANAQAEARSRATAEAQAQVEKSAAQAEVQVRATAEANAVQARTEADQQAALALARELGAAAELKMDTDPQLSLLLALQAISVTRSAGLGIPWDVQQTLHNVMPAQRLLWTRELPENGDEVAYSPDEKRIAMALGIWKTLVLDADTRQTLVEVKGLGLALSPDGKLLATGEPVAVGTVYLWDAITGRQLVTITGHPNPTGPGQGLYAGAFSPDGNYLATGGADGVVKVWDLTAWRAAGAPAGATIDQPAKILGCYDHTVSGFSGGISFSSDGKRLVTVCDKDQTATVWDMASGKEVLSVRGDTGQMLDAHFSPDGLRLATTNKDGTARLWEVATGKELLRLQPGLDIAKLAISPDGQVLATTSSALVMLWDLNTGARLLTLPNPSTVYGLVFSRDGKSLVTASSRIQAWDVTPRGRGELSVVPPLSQYGFNNSRDGSRFAVVDSGNLSLYDSATLQKLWATKIPPYPLAWDWPWDWGADGLSFSDDSALLSVGIATTITVWKADSGEKLYDLVQAQNVMEAALSSDGRRLAAGLENGDIVIWDLVTQKPLQTLTTTTRLACITTLEFSPDGTHLAVGGARVKYGSCSGGGSGGGLVYIWDLAQGLEQIPAPLELQFGSVNLPQLNFSPDGQRLAACGGWNSVKVWEVTTGRAIFTLTASTSIILDVNYSPDGKYLVTASFDNTANVWDAQTGTELLSYPLPDTGSKAFFTPQGQSVVTRVGYVFASYQLNAFLNFDDLMMVARARLLRDWQPGECLKYLHTATCPGQ